MFKTETDTNVGVNLECIPFHLKCIRTVFIFGFDLTKRLCFWQDGYFSRGQSGKWWKRAWISSKVLFLVSQKSRCLWHDRRCLSIAVQLAVWEIRIRQIYRWFGGISATKNAISSLECASIYTVPTLYRRLALALCEVSFVMLCITHRSLFSFM